MKYKQQAIAASIGLALTMSAGLSTVQASSHREAPFITSIPKVDGTDLYMFSSYEAGREGFVTIIANYLPLQDGYGGPNYFALDPEALYEIHIDNDGDAVEDITFQFEFDVDNVGAELNIGGQSVAVPVINLGPISETDSSSLLRDETYTVNVVTDGRRNGHGEAITNVEDGASVFTKPVDNIGNKSLPDYSAYANSFIYDIDIPNCATPGRMFVGQRQESFAVNLGEVFDLINTNPIGPEDGEESIIADKNITSISLEIPKECLVDGDDVIGAWTTASMRQARVLNPAPNANPNAKGASVEGGAWSQVSRLGNPLVNEVVIGVKDKDRFNASEPVNDADADIGFGTYVQYPTLPAIIEVLYPIAPAPTLFPRSDLVSVFLTGLAALPTADPDVTVDGNQPANVVLAEMLRLNTTTPAVDAYNQHTMGVIGGDNAGYPNGRRPGDDVVDIALRVVMGRLLAAEDAESKTVDFTDGAAISATQFQSVFPYLNTPLPGAITDPVIEPEPEA